MLDGKLSNGETITNQSVKTIVSAIKQNLSSYKNGGYSKPNSGYDMSHGSDYDAIDDPHIEGRIRF